MKLQRTHGTMNVRPLLARHILALAVVVVVFAVLNSIPVHTSPSRRFYQIQRRVILGGADAVGDMALFVAVLPSDCNW